jgi:hypothetical protein
MYFAGLYGDIEGGLGDSTHDFVGATTTPFPALPGAASGSSMFPHHPTAEDPTGLSHSRLSSEYGPVL